MTNGTSLMPEKVLSRRFNFFLMHASCTTVREALGAGEVLDGREVGGREALGAGNSVPNHESRSRKRRETSGNVGKLE